MSKRGIELYLKDILDSIDKIEIFTKGFSWDDFFVDVKTIDAVIRNLEIIGEAANNMPESLKLEYNNVPWIEIVGMRNKIVHEYFGVDNEILWDTIKNDLPDLKLKIQKIYSKLIK